MFKTARDTASALADRFAADFPSSLQDLTGRKTQDIYARALSALKTQASAAQQAHGFGVVSRIILARAFQSALKARNYNGGILRQATSELASALTFAMK